MVHFTDEPTVIELPVGQRLRLVLPTQGDPKDPGWTVDLHWFGHGGDWAGIAYREQAVDTTLTAVRRGKVEVRASWDYACFYYVDNPCTTRPVDVWKVEVTVVDHGRVSLTTGAP